MGRIALMARENNRLSAIGLASRPPGFHADGRGLYLSVSPSGSRSWIFRYMLRGRSRDMGLGSFPDITLADARTAAASARVLCKQGIDPIEQRDSQRAALRVEKARAVSFEDCASLYFEANKGVWRNAEHVRNWELSFKNHVFPKIGKVPVADVDVEAILSVIEPMWHKTPVTAGRVRGRIESILAYATARKYRKQGDANPARWRHHLEHLLPKTKKVRAVRHHPALPFDQIAAFVSDLRRQSTPRALGLEFLILTAARTAEVLGAKVSEVDFDSAVWTVPAERMKMGVIHQVPLSKVALSIAMQAAAANQTYLFETRGRRMEHKSFFKLLRSMDRGDLTTHGFRSTFRDWAAATTDHANHVVELALAHTVGKVEGAYRRDPMIEKRRALMSDWADYATRNPTIAAVIPIRSAG
jgi:integrase